MKRAVACIAALGLAATATIVGIGATALPSAADHSPFAGVWSLDEGSGQFVIDASGHGQHGVLGQTNQVDSDDPKWVSRPLFGGLAKTPALRFHGRQFVGIDDSPHLEPQEILVQAYVRATAPGQYSYIVSKGASGCDFASYGLYTGMASGLIFYVSTAENFYLSPDAGTDVWDGQWHEVQGLYDGERVRLLVDGVEVGVGTPAPGLEIVYDLPTHDRFFIGTYRGPCPASVASTGLGPAQGNILGSTPAGSAAAQALVGGGPAGTVLPGDVLTPHGAVGAPAAVAGDLGFRGEIDAVTVVDSEGLIDVLGLL